MTSSRPYLVRAIHEWIVDNGLTPQLIVNADMEGVDVPRQYVQDGKIVLNVSAKAVAGLVLGNDAIMFNARFAGVATEVCVPTPAVLAVYASENGVGMAFQDNDSDAPSSGPPDDEPPKPTLRVVK